MSQARIEMVLNTPNAATTLLRILTPEERIEAIGDFCGHCGCADSSSLRGCQCWNDE